MMSFEGELMASIAIRLDAGPSIGSGHLMRCTALAEELKQYGHKIILLCRNRLSQEVPFPVYYFDRPYSSQKCAQYDFPPIMDELPALVSVVKSEKLNCIIVDHHGATEEYFQALTEMGISVVAVDDMCAHPFPVDVVINGNIYAKDFCYQGAAHALLGPEYLLLRKEFQGMPPKQINPKVSKIYITSGGADPLHFCEAIMQCLVSLDMKAIQTYVIVGPDFEEEYVKRLKTLFPDTSFITNANMRYCMEDADLFITAAGSTLYELAACGTPSVSCILSEDQLRCGEIMDKKGLTCCFRWEQIGSLDVQQMIYRVVTDQSYRKNMSEQSQNLFSHDSLHRVANWINFNLCCKIK